EGREIATLGMWRIDGPLERQGPQLLVPGAGAQTRLMEEGKVRIGELELSSYTPLDATVQLVEAQRHFDASMQALQTYKRMDERATEIGRFR
ncbi:MAG: flagellar hook basal-body protein, partial [Deltaproteobacteria bacterium]|nr:flagellar hook basal-body protein [Deltaproteobacteria bacterium]